MYFDRMRRDEAVSTLRAIGPAIRACGVAGLYLFGSVARDEAGADSDLDVFVDPAGESFFRLGNYMGAYELIGTAFPGTEIRYSTRAGLSQHVRTAVEREAVRVF